MLTPALFTSAFPDGPNPNLLQPSAWNRVTDLLTNLLGTDDPTGALFYRSSSLTDGAGWIEPVELGQVLASQGVDSPPAWSDKLHVFQAGVTPSSGLSTSPMHLAFNADVGGAASLIRFENTSVAATTALFFDLLNGSVPNNNYVYGRWTIQGPAGADPCVKFGSGSNHDFSIVTAGGEILRFNRTTVPGAGPYFFGIGGLTINTPAFKRVGSTAVLQFRRGDDLADIPIIAQKLQLTGITAFAAGDKYVTIDAAGNLHVSATGPVS